MLKRLERLHILLAFQLTHITLWLHVLEYIWECFWGRLEEKTPGYNRQDVAWGGIITKQKIGTHNVKLSENHRQY